MGPAQGWTHFLAEREGFEPSRAINPAGFQDRCLQPLDHLSIFYCLLSSPGGEGGIRTPAPSKPRPTGLAIPPLQPLGYLSIVVLNADRLLENRINIKSFGWIYLLPKILCLLYHVLTMKKTLFTLFALALLFFSPGVSQAAEGLNLYFFYGDTCPHCAAEEVYLDEVLEEYPQIELHAFEIYKDQSNVRLFQQVAEKIDAEATGVPFLVVGDEAIVGYLEGLTDAVIDERVAFCLENECPDSVAGMVGLDEPAVPTLYEGDGDAEPMLVSEIEEEVEGVQESSVRMVNLPILGETDLAQFSLPVLAVVIGVLDGFNPCAMWVLLFLISMLLGMENKKRMWTLGTVFIVASAAVYFVFMSAWLNLILFLGFVFWVRLLIGLLALGVSGYNFKEYFFNKEAVCKITKGQKRQKVFDKIKTIISEKSFWIALVGIVLLAFAVNLVELVCSAGLPVIFTQMLALNDLSAFQHYLYIFIYILFFMIDDLIVFFVAMITLHVTGITTKYTRASRLIGGVLMLIIGLLMLFKPEWLMFG